MKTLTPLGLVGLLFVAGCQTPPPPPVGQTVTVEVEGISCPFCLPGVENNLASVPGIQGVDSSHWSEGKVNVTLEEGTSIPAEALRKAVIKSGFTPGEIQPHE